MAEATLMFCVGATKAGTGWLYEYLADHPQCHFRSIKELHYFDAIENGKLDREILKHETRHAVLAKKIASAGGEGLAEDVVRLRDRSDWLGVLRAGEDPQAYLAYLEAGRINETVIGDVTPAYALLSQGRLKAMSRLAAEVRFVYLLRDPVERLWSHVRMIAARRDPSGGLTRDRAARILRRTLRGEESQIARRSDYARNVSRLRRAVGPRLKLAFHEELFEGDAVRGICEHLGIDYLPPAGSRVVHRGPALDMTAEQRLAARDWLAPQYDFVAGTEGRMPPAWQN